MINWKGDKESLTIPEMVIRLNKAERSMHSRPDERIANYIKQVRGLERKIKRLQNTTLLCSENKSLQNENAELLLRLKRSNGLADELTYVHDEYSALLRKHSVVYNVHFNQTIWQRIKNFWSNK